MALQKRFNFGRAGTLFNEKTIKRALTKFHMDPTERQLKAAKDWAAQVRHPKFRAKETSVRGEFIQKVPITILGYKPYRADETFTIATEDALRACSYLDKIMKPKIIYPEISQRPKFSFDRSGSLIRLYSSFQPGTWLC